MAPACRHPVQLPLYTPQANPLSSPSKKAAGHKSGGLFFIPARLDCRINQPFEPSVPSAPQKAPGHTP